MQRSGPLIVAIAALLCSIIAVGVVVVRKNRSVPPAERIPDDDIDLIRKKGAGGFVRARAFEIANKDQIDSDDAKLLIGAATDPKGLLQESRHNTSAERESMGADDVVATRKTAIVIVGDCLRYSQVPQEFRQRLEQVIIDALVSPEASIRSSGLAAARQSKLVDRPDVAEKVRMLVNDPNPKIANLAAKVLEGEPKEE